MKQRNIRPQSAKLSFNQLNILPDTYKTSRTIKLKKQYTQQRQETRNSSFDDYSQVGSFPTTINNNNIIQVKPINNNTKKTNKVSQTLSKMIDTHRFSNPSLIQHSINLLRTSRPQSGYTKTSLDNSSFYTTHQQDEWNYQQFQTTQKKELYLDNLQLKSGYHSLKDDNLKIKSSIVKLEQKIALLNRQLGDFNVLEKYAEPSMKDQPAISPSKKKQNENNQVINVLKRSIKAQKDLIEQKTQETEDIKKMLRTLDLNDLNIEKKILVDASMEYKERVDKTLLQYKIGTLLQRNDYQQLEGIYQQKIRELQKQNVKLSQIYTKEQEQTDKIKNRFNNSNQEVASLRRQIQETDAHIKLVKQELVNNKLKKGKNEERQNSPGSPKEKVFIRQLDGEKSNLISEKIELQDEFNKAVSTESQKKQIIETSKNTYLNAIDEKKEQNQDLKEQLHIIREQNRELQMRLENQQRDEFQEDSNEGDDLQIKNFYGQDSQQNSTKNIDSNLQLNKNSSLKLNGNHRKNSMNSQKSSDRDSLQYSQSKYGTATQQKVISNYSPFQTTNQKNLLMSTLKNDNMIVGLPEIQTQEQKDQQQNSQNNNKKTPSYPLINVKQASNNQDIQKQSSQEINLDQISSNIQETTPKTSKRLEYFYSSEAQRLSSQQRDNNGQENSDQKIEPFIFNSESIKQLKKKEFSNLKISDPDNLNIRQNTDSQSRRSSQNNNNKNLLGVKSSDTKRRQSENNEYSSSNFDECASEHQNSAKNSTKQLSLFKRLSVQKRVRKVSDMTSSAYSLNNDFIQENNSEMSERSARENICYVDVEREKFIEYLQQTIDLEKECSKFENLIKNKELLTFPNPQNKLTHITFNQSTHNVVNTIFGYDSNCFNYDIIKQRIKSSHIMQDLIVSYLEDQSTKKSFQIRKYEVHKVVNERKRFDHSMMLAVSIGLPHILKQISLNVIALPELSNSSFEFINQFQIGNKEVYKAVIKRTMQSCTLISFPLDTSHQLEMLLKEIELTSIIDSAYILKPLCSYIDREDSKYYLNIIYGPLIGNLEDFLEKYEVQESERIKMCYQIALGIQDIHLENCIHTQIKPDNIMITENFTPLITNLKESSSLSEQKVEKETQGINSSDINKSDNKQSLSYTYQWILSKCNSWSQKNIFTHQDTSGKYDFSFDIYSLGLIIYYILTQKHIPPELKEDSITSFEEIKKILTDLDTLPLDQQIIIKMCLEKQTSIQGILYRLKKLIDNQDLEEIHNAEQSLNMLVQEQTPEKQSEAFFEKGRLVCQIENGQIDGVGMLFRSNNIGQKVKNLIQRNTNTDKKNEDQNNVQMECLISHFKGETIQGKSIYIRQNEPYIHYLRDQNDNMIYIFDSNTDELISCKLHQKLPCIKGELDEKFLDKLTDSNLQCTNHLVLPDKTELIRNPKTHTLILKKPGFGEIHYSPISIKYYLPNDDYILVEKSKTFMYQSLNSSLNIVLPTQNCKEKIQLSSKDYFFEFINVNPYYILTLSKKNNEKQPVTAIFDNNFYLNTYLPAENSIKISNVQVNGGYLGFVINVKQNTVIFGIFKSPSETIILQGFKITNNSAVFLQDFDIKQEDSECQSPLKSVKRGFFSSEV